MTSGHVIAAASHELETAVKGTTSAAAAVAAAGSELRTAIPADAFGALGYGVVVAGNGVGSAVSTALTLLSKVSSATAAGVRAAHDEFGRVEDDAVAHFRKLESELGG